MRVDEYQFGDHRLVVSARELWSNQQLTVLPRRVFDCLLYLLERRDRAVGRDELAAAIWERVDVSDGQIGQLVMRVRRALGDDGQAQSMIRTIPGFGYRWVCPTDAIAADDRSPAHEDTAPESAAPTAAERPPRYRQWPRFVLAAFAVAAIAAMLYALVPTVRAPALGEANDGVVIVLPVLVGDDGVGESAWMRLGLMDLIGERLRTAGLPVPQTEHGLALAAQLPDSGDTAETPSPTAFPDAADVGRVIQARAERMVGGWRLLLDAHGRDGGRHRQSAEHRDVVVAARLAADRLLAALGQLAPETGTIDTAVEERVQRAQAALLANELDVARRILLAAPGSDRDDPRVRLRLAQIEFRAGRIDIAHAALDALIDGPAAITDPRLRSQALRSRGSLHIRIGRDQDAERDFDLAGELAPETAQAELGWAMNGRAVARLILGRLDEAATDLGRARVHLERAGEVRGVLSVDNNMGLLELARLRPALAIGHSADASRRFESIGALNEALSAQAVAIEAHLVQLQWLDALAINDRGWLLRERVDDPDVLLSLTVLRARILLGLGQLEAAATLLDGVETRAAETQDWNRSELHAVRAELAWLRGDQDGSAYHAGQALALTLTLTPDSADDGRRARTLLLALRSGAVDAPTLPSTATGRSEASPYLLLAIAEHGATREQSERTDGRYQQAFSTAEQRGLPAEIAAVASSYGPWLLADGRDADASAVIGRVAPWAERDFDCALLQVALFHHQGDPRAWSRALEQARALAGERSIPALWLAPPQR